ncbi:hypothetical protein CTAYLR_008897 [Chrysophaeum taylorii]|uniref:Secreted protein n=1 Tax=Chrysophaeum taylorii TaxID=2483200 RepID=A0AAD7XRP9_9STRA|nr:hypothetical protein CTAYLR_008897 [Chrysophaeum taylorii]
MAKAFVLGAAVVISRSAWGFVGPGSERGPWRPRSQMLDTDALIEELAATAPFNLPAKVSQEAVMRTVGRPQFFLRIAELCDEADGATRERYKALADNLSNTLSAVVERTESKLEDASQRLAGMVAAASEEDGEFLMPLSPDKRQALKEAVEAAEVDEPVLSTLSAVAKKAETDGMDGVVAILRKVLQLYAAKALAFDPTAVQDSFFFSTQRDQPPRDAPEIHPDYVGAIDTYNQLLEADADDWDAILQRQDDSLKKSSLLAIVQAQIERVVLLEENGSFAQRVQAEFLRELVTRVEANMPSDDDEEGAPADIVSAILNDP